MANKKIDLKNNEKETKKKKKFEMKQILTAILAGALCLMMLLSVCATLIAYLMA